MRHKANDKGGGNERTGRLTPIFTESAPMTTSTRVQGVRNGVHR